MVARVCVYHCACMLYCAVGAVPLQVMAPQPAVSPGAAAGIAIAATVTVCAAIALAVFLIHRRKRAQAAAAAADKQDDANSSISSRRVSGGIMLSLMGLALLLNVPFFWPFLTHGPDPIRW